MAEDLYLGHKQIMEENNITPSDLPREIESKILSLTLLISSYDSTPSEELKDRIEHQSAKVGHEILDYLEKDLPDEPDNQINYGGQPAQSESEKTEGVKQENTEKRSGISLFNFFGF